MMTWPLLYDEVLKIHPFLSAHTRDLDILCDLLSSHVKNTAKEKPLPKHNVTLHYPTGYCIPFTHTHILNISLHTHTHIYIYIYIHIFRDACCHPMGAPALLDVFQFTDTLVFEWHPHESS